MRRKPGGQLIAERHEAHQLGVTAPLTIRSEPGGCLPGTLEYICGTTDLCIWDPQFGAMCDRCHRCWGFPPQGAPKARIVIVPGLYTMTAIPAVAALMA